MPFKLGDIRRNKLIPTNMKGEIKFPPEKRKLLIIINIMFQQICSNSM